MVKTWAAVENHTPITLQKGIKIDSDPESVSQVEN